MRGCRLGLSSLDCVGSLVFNLNFGEDFVEGSRRRGKKKDQKCSIRFKIIS